MKIRNLTMEAMSWGVAMAEGGCTAKELHQITGLRFKDLPQTEKIRTVLAEKHKRHRNIRKRLGMKETG